MPNLSFYYRYSLVFVAALALAACSTPQTVIDPTPEPGLSQSAPVFTLDNQAELSASPADLSPDFRLNARVLASDFFLASEDAIFKELSTALPRDLTLTDGFYELYPTGQMPTQMVLSIPAENITGDLTRIDALIWQGDQWRFTPSFAADSRLNVMIPAQAQYIVLGQLETQFGVINASTASAALPDSINGIINALYLNTLETQPSGQLAGTLLENEPIGGIQLLLPTITATADVLDLMLLGPDLQQAHFAAVIDQTVAQGYAGAVLAYDQQNKASTEAYSAFIEAIAFQLRANNRLVVLKIPAPSVSDGRFSLPGHDLQTLQNSVDFVEIDITRDILNGTAHDTLRWLTSQLDRRKLRLHINVAAIVDQAGTLSTTSLSDAWTQAGSVSANKALTPGSTLNLQIGGTNTIIAKDEANGALLIQPIPDKKIYYPLAAFLSGQFSLANQFNLAGVTLQHFDVGQANPTLWPVVQAYQSQSIDTLTMLDPTISWQVIDEAGTRTLTTLTLGETFQWQPETVGNYQITANLDGALPIQLIDTTLSVVDGAAETDPIAVGAVTPTAANETIAAIPTSTPATAIAQLPTATTGVVPTSTPLATTNAALPTATPIVAQGVPTDSVAPTAIPATAVQAAATAVPTATSVPQVETFAFGGQVPDGNTISEDFLRAAGMGWIKIQANEESAHDHGPDIAKAHALGFKILLSTVGNRSRPHEPAYQDEFAVYVANLAAQGADAIEIWNEPNLDREWPNGQIDPAIYAQMLQKSYIAIKAANPNTMVISGSPAPTGFFGGCQPGGCDDGPYLDGLHAAGAGAYMDCIGIHYNEGIISPNQATGDPRGAHYTRYFPGMVERYSQAFGGTEPLCFTEIGYLSGEEWGSLPQAFQWKGPFNNTVAEQTQFLLEAVQLGKQDERIKMMIIFNLNFTVWGDDPQAGYALIRPNGSCPSCEGLRQIVSGS